MRKEELRQRLDTEGIPTDCYCLEGGLPNDRYCLEKTSIGWEVYYSEQGIKYKSVGFGSEDDACEYLYNQLIHLKRFL